jgi:hypothetical protein
MWVYCFCKPILQISFTCFIFVGKIPTTFIGVGYPVGIDVQAEITEMAKRENKHSKFQQIKLCEPLSLCDFVAE